MSDAKENDSSSEVLSEPEELVVPATEYDRVRRSYQRLSSQVQRLERMKREIQVELDQSILVSRAQLVDRIMAIVERSESGPTRD